MELWIRSQDREKIVKVNYFYITKVDENHFNIVGETVDSGPRIGTYKTKERALEVLDEIQKLFSKKIGVIKPKIPIRFDELEQAKNAINYINNEKFIVVPYEFEFKELEHNIVYEMPLE